ncbi:hypothetical protein Bca4012_100382 [Brassica carinata]|uniref:(rape) hypothetical protein n=1 Tax=Brassica napus TaxID=3708 RepID=A0A816QI46_BRANA|nr:unnamed protein product [Brassica napus]
MSPSNRDTKDMTKTQQLIPILTTNQPDLHNRLKATWICEKSLHSFPTRIESESGTKPNEKKRSTRQP